MTDDRKRRLFGGCSPELIASFTKFHAENPKMFELFLRFSREAKNAGRERFSGWMIANRIRWYSTIETKGEFKISNNHIAMYTRLIAYLHPEFESFFQFKSMKYSGADFSDLLAVDAMRW